MLVFSASRGHVSQILDHKMMPMALNGRELRVMHLQIEWSNVENPSERFSWEPLSRINRDVPQLVEEYFKCAKLNLEAVLNEEAGRRGNNLCARKNTFTTAGGKGIG